MTDDFNRCLTNYLEDGLPGLVSRKWLISMVILSPQNPSGSYSLSKWPFLWLLNGGDVLTTQKKQVLGAHRPSNRFSRFGRTFLHPFLPRIDASRGADEGWEFFSARK